MIQFWHRTTSYGNIYLECSGHAGYAEKGSDIICAAASMMMEATALALKKSRAPRLEITVDEEAPKYIIRCQMTQQTSLLVRPCICGFEMLSKEAPSHVSCHCLTAESRQQKKN